MTTATASRYEIAVDGVPRTMRDLRETAVEAARYLKVRNPASKITVTDLRDGSVVPFDQPHR